MICNKCGTTEGGTWGMDNGGWLCSACSMTQRGLRIIELESALREFCSRVEHGEIRSVDTYKKFKQLLEDKQ